MSDASDKASDERADRIFELGKKFITLAKEYAEAQTETREPVDPQPGDVSKVAHQIILEVTTAAMQVAFLFAAHMQLPPDAILELYVHELVQQTVEMSHEKDPEAMPAMTQKPDGTLN